MSDILAHGVALLGVSLREELSQSVVKCKGVETCSVKNESKHNIHGIYKTNGMQELQYCEFFNVGNPGSVADVPRLFMSVYRTFLLWLRSLR